MGTWASTAWAAQPRAAIVELMWLALRAYRFDSGSLWAAGVAAAAGWAVGGRAAPVTERYESPVTLDLATAEMWAALVAGDEAPDGLTRASSRSFVQAEVFSKLGVAWREPLPVPFAFADGAWRTLRWLTGVEGQEAPLAVPVRHPDGSLVSADDLYEQAVAEAPWRYRLPEQQIELRNRVDSEARRSRVLADQVVDTIGRVRDRSPALQQ